MNKYLILYGIALLVRLIGISNEGFSYDEMSSIRYALEPSVSSLFWDNHPPLHTLLMKIYFSLLPSVDSWLTLSGSQELWLRMPSAVFGALTPVVMYRVGEYLNRYDDRKVVINSWLDLPTVLFVFSCFANLSIRYAQEFRMYTYFELASAIFILCLIQYRFEAKKVRLIASSLFLISTHLFGLFALLTLSFFVWILFENNKKVSLKDIFTPIVVLLLVVLAKLFLLLRPEYLEWQKHIYTGAFNQISPFLWVSQFIGGNEYVGLFLCILLVLSSSSTIGSLQRLSFTTLILLLAPVIATVALHRLIAIPRYFIFFVPIIVLWLGLIMREMRVLKYLIILLIPFFSYLQMTNYTKPEWSKVAGVLAELGIKNVYTSRGESVAYPYFVQRGIKVNSIPGQSVVAEFLSQYDQTKEFYFMDSIWGEAVALGMLTKTANYNAIPFEVKYYRHGGGDRLFLFYTRK